jgi:hypothetical protein
MKIVIGNDHAAVELKKEIMAYVESLGHEVVNFGVDTTESCNYPEIGAKVGRAVVEEDYDCGILICGTGVGISIAANGGQMTKTRYVLDENKTVNKIPVLERSEAFELKKMLNNNVYAYASFYNVQGKESIGGKSGTPQRDLIGVADNVTDGWFICYIDNVTVGTEKTSLAVAVRLERGGGSSSAAKITTEAILPTLDSLKYIK